MLQNALNTETPKDLNDFKIEIEKALTNKPANWRQGQFVFNYIESVYGEIAREVQFIDDIDCFYNDEKIDNFIKQSFLRLNGYLKIVAISDLHGDLPDDLPMGDILIICGDILPLRFQGYYEESIVWLVTKFFPWAQKLSFKKVIFIAGNHDFALEKLSITLLDKLDPLNEYDKLVYLEDEPYTYKGVKFYGTPWIQDLKRWAYYQDHEKLKEIFERIPIDTDILITHQPPKYKTCGTVLQKSSYNYLKDYGNKELNDVINERPNLKYAFFGHVHSGCHEITENQNGTKLVNVSLKDEDYKSNYNPLIIEYYK